jgi:hypothetical protein
MLLGGPVVSAIGGRSTLLASAVLTIALGVLVAVAVHFARLRHNATRATRLADDHDHDERAEAAVAVGDRP